LLVSAAIESTPSAPSTAPRSRSGAILRYKADRGPVAFVLGAFVARWLVFLLVGPALAAASALPLLLLGMFIAPINHHHQHVNTFQAGWLNRLYELALSLQTGIGPFGWVLHHNLGHHRNYLRQPPSGEADESHWTRSDGSQMGRVEYTLHLVLHHQVDIFRVGRKHPVTLRRYLWMKLPLYTLLGAAFWWNPWNAFFVFLLPGFLTLVHTSWATYEHHAGCATDGHMDASTNRLNPLYNRLTGNLGYHTAHHHRPGLHWSLLPGHHARIADQIPEAQVLRTFW